MAIKLTNTNIKEFTELLEEDGFKKLKGTAGVPASNYEKDGLGFSTIHGRIHTSESGKEYLKNKGIDFEEIEIKKL